MISFLKRCEWSFLFIWGGMALTSLEEIGPYKGITIPSFNLGQPNTPNFVSNWITILFPLPFHHTKHSLKVIKIEVRKDRQILRERVSTLGMASLPCVWCMGFWEREMGHNQPQRIDEKNNNHLCLLEPKLRFVFSFFKIVCSKENL